VRKSTVLLSFVVAIVAGCSPKSETHIKYSELLPKIEKLEKMIALEKTSKKAEYLYELARLKEELGRRTLPAAVVKMNKNILKDMVYGVDKADYEEKWNNSIRYIESKKNEFTEYDPGMCYLYNESEQRTIVKDYPGTELAKKCEFELITMKMGEWEGFSEYPLKTITDVKAFMKKYPEQKEKDYVIGELSFLYAYLLNCHDIKPKEKAELIKEAGLFYSENKNRIEGTEKEKKPGGGSWILESLKKANK